MISCRHGLMFLLLVFSLDRKKNLSEHVEAKRNSLGKAFFFFFFGDTAVKTKELKKLH